MFKRTLIKLIGKIVPVDIFARKYPVSVKGLVLVDGKIPLLKNDRNEWELPGGKLDPDESPETCAARELHEELNIKVSVRDIIDVWMYDIQGKVKVLIVTYGCELQPGQGIKDLKLSYEHKELSMFTFEEIQDLHMPQGYKGSIRKWQQSLLNIS